MNHDLTQARDFVDRAIRSAVAPCGGWGEPTPLANLTAGLAVIRLAERRTYDYAVRLRSEGTAWAEIADLLGVPYSDSYARLQHTYELVRGPIPEDSGPWDQHNLHWRCGGPGGCGEYITDRGPYESHPADNEDGHAKGCPRHRDECAAYMRDREERDRRSLVMDAAFATMTDRNDRATVERCRATVRRGGEIFGKWSTTEQLAVAVVLRDHDFLSRTAYKTEADAIARVWSTTPDRMKKRLAALRAAALGETAE